ncbi:amino acid adenylation domain-containing protein [Streptomyces sp. AV19]|uniref:non-ribosomal peptide synthetase n=1 Tax=Streptomyces sp. AV19 TaxID=2793068 RepID=UPI0018FE87BE|nr:amino acid adenylation domain-containing protein [Streptomyces sp. AV19]MBH1933795.1 amino acid adenylation domain-containing protein [Streptomyces sp. AV19]MDG4535700.1 amino acid adenylation domain-containing protein [Streptomyces sp. AV19]
MKRMHGRTAALTAAQHKLYLHGKVFPKDTSHNLAIALRMPGDLDAARLRLAVETFLNANVAFNTVFSEHEGDVRAVYDPNLRYSVPLSHHEGDAAEWVRERMSRMARRQLPADRWPLYEYEVARDEHATYLTILMSHLICDVFSFYRVGREIGRLYADPSAQPVGADTSPLDFPDDPRPAPGAKEFFRSMLGSLRTLSMDQLESSRNDDEILEGSHLWLPLERELSDAISKTAAELGVRKFSFFLGVHMLLLGTLSGSRTVITAVPLGNRRRHPGQDAAFGYFVNTLPLAVGLDAYTTFGELCRDLEDRMGSLIRFEDFDLAACAAEVMPAGRTGRLTPSSSFTYYREQLAFRVGDRPAESLEIDRRDLIYPVVARVEDLGGTYGYHLAYTDALVSSGPEEVLLTLLRSVARGHDTNLHEARGVSPDRARAIDAMVNRHASFLTPPSLQSVFEDRATEYPDRIAVQYGTESRTYRELDEQANRIARQLRLTVSAEHVAVALDRGCDLIAVLLGVLKAGKTYIPLDATSPETRVRHVIGQFEDLPLIVGPDTFPGFVHEGCIPLGGLLEDAAALPSTPLPRQDLRDRPAYVIFTSGSTGKPKGVQVTHANVLRLFLASHEHFRFTADDVWCLFHSYAFDFAVWEMYGALLHGGRLVIPADTVRKSPDQFADFLSETGVTVLNQTPSAFRQLVQAFDGRHVGRNRVRCIIFGGEALQFDSLGRWLDLFGNQAELVNMYGITETTVHVTYYRVTAQDVAERRPSIIGKPLADLAIRIVDRELAPVPVGVPGEMLVSGGGVSLGYLGQPELTAERFVELPGEQGRFYRSGDLARMLPDGDLVYMGRMDQQVQLRGYRIEPGEVEVALRGVPGVADCAVLLDERTPEPRLVAFVVAAVPLDEREVRATMKSRVPSYMLPSLYVTVPTLPLTMNGKVDTSALPWPGTEEGGQLSLVETDRSVTPAMGMVARVWREVLGFSEFTADDRFFDIGGSSAQVIQVHERLREESAPGLEMIDLFEYTTVRELANHLEALAEAAGSMA